MPVTAPKQPQEMLDRAVKDAWWACLLHDFMKKHNRPPLAADMAPMIQGMTNVELLDILKASAGYEALPPSLRNDAALIAAIRNAKWPAASES